jgi:phosphoenolpyruvate-protein kinase (PTS system EI component)
MRQIKAQDDLKKLIKESVREVLREERLGLCEIMIPHVSRKELNEIYTKFGSPVDYRKDDFTDMTDWVKE